MPSSLSELAVMLDELEPTAAMAEAARKALPQKETLALQERAAAFESAPGWCSAMIRDSFAASRPKLWGSYAFQIQEELELSCEMAVKSYGLDAIC